VARIAPAKLEGLRGLLGEMGKDPAANGVVPLGRSSKTHFARWVIVDAPGTRPLLVFESNHDGSREDYLDELLAIAGAGLAAIYEHCEGYPAGDTKGYLLGCAVGYAAFYRGYPARSVAEVKAALDIRGRIRRYVGAARGDLVGLPARAIKKRIEDELRRQRVARQRLATVRSFPLRWFTDALQAAVGPLGPARTRATALLIGLLAIPAVVLLALDVALRAGGSHVLAIAAAAWVAGLAALALAIRAVESRQAVGAPPPPLADPHVLSAQEDRVVQNQLTHVAVIKPGALRMLLLRGVLGAINLLARITFTVGDLGGIPSIHFARWVILDDRRLLFLSNFDGSWDSYLGDFIDLASGGLSGVWGNTEWFPRTALLFWDGARSADEFKQWTRDRQVPTQVWYTAYPLDSVANIRDAIATTAKVDVDMSEDEAAAWVAAI
jgi:hypothetical protein